MRALDKVIIPRGCFDGIDLLAGDDVSFDDSDLLKLFLILFITPLSENECKDFLAHNLGVWDTDNSIVDAAWQEYKNFEAYMSKTLGFLRDIYEASLQEETRMGCMGVDEVQAIPAGGYLVMFNYY